MKSHYEPIPMRYFAHALVLLTVLASAAQAQQWVVSEQKVTAFDAAAGDIYGAAVAIDGDRAIVCSEWDDDNGTDSGAVYAYSWKGTEWGFDQKFSPADNQAGDNFGRSIFMQGTRTVVGTHWDDDNGNNSGSVYVLRFNGSEWVQDQKLKAADGQAGDLFGNTVSLDGSWIAIGAWNEDQRGTDAGAVYMFRHNGSTWVQDQKLVAPDGSARDHFGRYVSVNHERVLIGAWREDQGGMDAGAAYIFRYNGSEWVFETKLVAFDSAPSDVFGWATYLQGDVAVVGAFGDDDLGAESGSAYVYRYNGSSWAFEQKLLASDGVAKDNFGYSLSLNDGRLAVSAVGNGPGYAYVFRHNGERWVQRRKLVPSDGSLRDRFGFQLATSGGVVLSGAWRDDVAGTETGSAYFYHCTFVGAPRSSSSLLRSFARHLRYGQVTLPELSLGPGAVLEPRLLGRCW